MSADHYELAGNYVTSGGTGDPNFVAERLAEMQEQRAAEAAEAVEGESVREHVETAETVDNGEIHVAGEAIPITNPLGLGRRAKLGKQAFAADESDNEVEQLDAVLALIDACNEATPDEYGEDFWYSLQDDEVRSAFQQLGQQSAGGLHAGE